jgi:hypothetical protein
MNIQWKENRKGKQWRVQIYYDNKRHYLGSFDTKQEAALVYDREARQCGFVKPLNFESMAEAEEAAIEGAEAAAAEAKAEQILVLEARAAEAAGAAAADAPAPEPRPSPAPRCATAALV